MWLLYGFLIVIALFGAMLLGWYFACKYEDNGNRR